MKKMPAKVKPMLATLIKEPFNDPNWLFEIKWDGYRAIAEIKKGHVNFHSRNNHSFKEKFPSIFNALQQIKHDVILDGEVVALDEKGRSDFQLLQDFQKTGKGNIFYYLFDILYLDGRDLTNLPLIERKKLLRNFLPADVIRYSDHVLARGKDFFKIAKRNKLEGIMAKKLDSKYQMNKRSKDWLKIKYHLRQEAIITGFTEPKGSRKAFGSLVLGVYEKRELKFIGQVGSGFDEMRLNEIIAKLKPLAIKISPFKRKPKLSRRVTWVKPKLVCEVRFSEWTKDGLMRQPIFLGLREDKNPKDVQKELPQGHSNENR